MPGSIKLLHWDPRNTARLRAKVGHVCSEGPQASPPASQSEHSPSSFPLFEGGTINKSIWELPEHFLLKMPCSTMPCGPGAAGTSALESEGKRSLGMTMLDKLRWRGTGHLTPVVTHPGTHPLVTRGRRAPVPEVRRAGALLRVLHTLADGHGYPDAARSGRLRDPSARFCG